MAYVMLARLARHRPIMGGVIAGLFALGTAFPTKPSAAAEQWQAYTYWGSPTVVAAQGFRKLTDDIQSASDGAITIKFNLGGSLSIAASNINSAVSDDVVQLADDAFYQGAIPSGGLTSLPFLIRNIDEMRKVVGILRPTIEKQYEKRDITVLGYYIYPAQTFWSRGAIAALAEVSGKKYRVTSPEQADFLKLFGGLPVNIGSADVPAALERGVVDGVLTAPAGGVLAWKELLKSSYHIEVNYPVAWIIANKDRFSALPPALQAKIKDVARADLDKLTTDLQTEDASITDRLKSEGMTMTSGSDADEAAARAKMAPVWEDWAKSRGPEAVDLLKQVRAALSR